MSTPGADCPLSGNSFIYYRRHPLIYSTKNLADNKVLFLQKLNVVRKAVKPGTAMASEFGVIRSRYTALGKK
jgi:hypothetical protein